MPDSNDGSPARAEVRTSIALQPVAPPPAPVSRCRQAQLRHIPLASQAAGSALSRTELSRPSPVSRTEPLHPGPASRRLSRSIEAPFVQDFELSEPSFISQSKKDSILNFPNEKHPFQTHIVQEIELSESEVAIARATPFGKFKILHQAPSNDASTATSSNETSSKASRTHPRVTLHAPTSRPPPLPRCFRLCFCPCFHLCLLSLFPPLPLACASVSTPASIIVFAFRLCFRAPVFAFALRPPLCFHLRVRARSSPSSAAAASPRVAGFTPPPETLT